MKVLRIIARLNIGGPARHVVLLDRGLRERGYQTLLVHGSLDPGEGSLEQLAVDHGVPTCRVPELGRRINVFSDVQAFFSLLKITFREEPDVVHTHTAKAGTLGRLAAMVFNLTRPRAKRCVIVHTFHGHVLTGYFGPWGSRLARLAERALAMGTDSIVVLSASQKRDIVSRFAIASDAQTFIVPLGLDLAPLLQLQGGDAELRSELGIPSDVVVIAYVGRMVGVKDLGVLIRAFAMAGRDRRLSLLLVGDGPLRVELERMVHEAGVETRTRFLGWRQDLPSVYAAADICALSSVNEGTPVSLIEAMAAGKPVVASAVGGVPDIVKNGETGLLFAAGDAEAMAMALSQLSQNAQERDRMGRLAREMVSKRFSCDRLVEDINRLYLTALSTKRASVYAASERTP